MNTFLNEHFFVLWQEKNKRWGNLPLQNLPIKAVFFMNLPILITLVVKINLEIEIINILYFISLNRFYSSLAKN